MNDISQNKILCQRNNTEFTNVSSFTSLLACSKHNTLSCRILLCTSSPATISLSLCILKSPVSLPGRSCLGPQGVVCFSGNWSSPEITHFNSGFLISRTFLPHAGSTCTVLFCLYLVSCIQKNALKSTQTSIYNTTFSQPFYSVPQNRVITEVLVCSVYALH